MSDQPTTDAGGDGATVLWDGEVDGGRFRVKVHRCGPLIEWRDGDGWEVEYDESECGDVAGHLARALAAAQADLAAARADHDETINRWGEEASRLRSEVGELEDDLAAEKEISEARKTVADNLRAALAACAVERDDLRARAEAAEATMRLAMGHQASALEGYERERARADRLQAERDTLQRRLDREVEVRGSAMAASYEYKARAERIEGVADRAAKWMDEVATMQNTHDPESECAFCMGELFDREAADLLVALRAAVDAAKGDTP